MLELDDIQYFLLKRPPALAGRFDFLSFRHPGDGKKWLAGMIEKVKSGKSVDARSVDSSWASIAFTWNGLRALGLDEQSLATFPEEFRQGMVERAEILGATGANHPDHWVGGLSSDRLHAVVMLFARDASERDQCKREHDRYLYRIGGVDVLSGLDLEAIRRNEEGVLPGVYEHFGYRDRLSQVRIEGLDEEIIPGSGDPIKAGEFFLGYVDESGYQPALPRPEILSRNGSYLAYQMFQEHVGRFRDYLKKQGKTREEQELVAAKLMGRWRSGAPLVLAPHKDDPELGADLQRTNNFDYGKQDPHGYGCPIGAHIRRMNPRDTTDNMKRHKMIRRGGTYGPWLPEGAPEDGVERGIAGFIGCSSLVRQFEFAMSVWANDPNFKGLGNERDPIVGTQNGEFDMTIPKRPIRKMLKSLPAFTTWRSGAYFFHPGIRALQFLAERRPP